MAPTPENAPCWHHSERVREICVTLHNVVTFSVIVSNALICVTCGYKAVYASICGSSNGPSYFDNLDILDILDIKMCDVSTFGRVYTYLPTLYLPSYVNVGGRDPPCKDICMRFVSCMPDAHPLSDLVAIECMPHSVVCRFAALPLQWQLWETNNECGMEPRKAHSAVYHPDGEGYMVVFGGSDGSFCLNTTYTLDLHFKNWEMLDASGEAPAPRCGFAHC